MYNGLKIRKLIESKGVLQKDVYKKAGMSKPTFDGLINEGANPTARNLELIADVLQCPIDYFFDRNIELPDSVMSVNGNGNKVQNGDGNMMIENQAKDIQYLKQLLDAKEKALQDKERHILTLEDKERFILKWMKEKNIIIESNQ